MRRSLSVKATYDGVVRLPMSLAMISTLRERKTRASKFLFRQSSSSSSSSIARVIVPIIAFPALGRDEISRGRRRNAARVATRPRPVPPTPTDDRPNDTHKKNHAFPRARPASHHRRPPRVHRLSRRHAHHHLPSRSPPRRRKTPHPPPHRARDSNAPIVLPDTDARIRRAEIDPDRGTFSLTHDDSRCACVVKCRRVASRPSGRGRFASKRSFSKVGARVCVWVCDESSLVDGEGAGTARACVSGVSGVVLWMICVDV